MQRLHGTMPNCTFLATEDDTLVKAAALIRLQMTGYVESVRLRWHAAHLLAHQIMALSIQEEGGVPESDWWAWVSSATPFQGLTADDRRELVEHMIAYSAPLGHSFRQDADNVPVTWTSSERSDGFVPSERSDEDWSRWVGGFLRLS